MPSGVHGTRFGCPMDSKPLFSMVKPSTSFCGMMALITLNSFMCGGNGN